MNRPKIVDFVINTFNNMTDEYYMKYEPQRVDHGVIENLITIYRKDIPKEEHIICPTINLNDFDDNEYDEEIIKESLNYLLLSLPEEFDTIKNMYENPIDELNSLSKEDILNKCYLMIANTEKNKEFLQGMAIKEFMDLSYYFVIDIDCDDYTISNIIKEDLLKNMNITIDELYKAAMANSKKMLNMKSINILDYIGILREKIGIEAEDLPTLFPISALVVHPEDHEDLLYGSVVISDTEIMDSLCDKLKSDKIVIVPCSVYELIADVYNNDIQNYLGFDITVNNVNKSMDEKDVLSDNCYIYDSNSKEFMFLKDEK